MRFKWLSTIVGMAPVFDKVILVMSIMTPGRDKMQDTTIEQLLPIFLSLLKDEFPDVRLNIIIWPLGVGILLDLARYIPVTKIKIIASSAGWLERYPKKPSILKLAAEGSWFNQFRAVTLLRISPFPYIV